MIAPVLFFASAVLQVGIFAYTYFRPAFRHSVGACASIGMVGGAAIGLAFWAGRLWP